MPLAVVPAMNERTGEFPFLLITGRTPEHYQTGTLSMRCKSLIKRWKPCVEICQEDARTHGLSEGERVLIESEYGRIGVKMRISEEIDRGCLFMPFHFRESAANILTSHWFDPLSKTPTFKATRVRIRRLEENEGAGLSDKS